jgi:DNA-binding NarL/FixJ family response regulator
MSALFGATWTRAEPHGGTRPAARDRTLLSLMSRGVADGCAARSLGISMRTYRRRVADLMERLGASSRFQAGVLAAGGGWLDEPVMQLLGSSLTHAGATGASRSN